jgi:hypothetical protein
MAKFRSEGARRSSLLPPAPPGHGDFWATVHVKFTAPVQLHDSPAATPAQGYYRSFGIRARPNRVQVVISNAIKDGAIDWLDTEWCLVDPSGLGRGIRVNIQPVAGEGIWYMSGRAIYSDPDL